MIFTAFLGVGATGRRCVLKFFPQVANRAKRVEQISSGLAAGL